MEEESTTVPQIYRAGVHLMVVIGILVALCGALGIFIGVKAGNWAFLGIVLGVAALFFLLLQVLRLEIMPTGFKYRNLTGSREVAFADVGRAYFEVVRAKNAPQGAAAFWVERRDGSRVKINLRTFSVEAAAVLFNALESSGVQVEVPDAWAARRMADQVKAAQAKLRQ